MNWLGSYATEGIDGIRRRDQATGGHYLLVPTVAEILQGAGDWTITAGSKPVVILHDRANPRSTAAARQSVTLYKGKTIPRSMLETLVKANEDKAFPTNASYPNTVIDGWTTRAVTHGLWAKSVPKYTLLWMSEPDASQHEHGVASDSALGGIESNDKNLVQVLKKLEEKGVLDETDLLVVSDHGFTTVQRGPDLAEVLKKAKFKAYKTFEDPEVGDVLVVGLGGSTALYVWGRDEATSRRLVDFLQGADFAGVIFSRIKIEGTFPLEQVRNGSEHGPDVLVSFRSNNQGNDYGAPGLFVSEGGKKGKGSHSSLSQSDMHNMLVAAGPNFRRGLINELPSGNIDLAPTILHLLGVQSTSRMDGRVLGEALVEGGTEGATPRIRTVEASRDLGLHRWHQYLKCTEYQGRIYFDEGNGEALRK